MRALLIGSLIFVSLYGDTNITEQNGSNEQNGSIVFSIKESNSSKVAKLDIKITDKNSTIDSKKILKQDSNSSTDTNSESAKLAFIDKATSILEAKLKDDNSSKVSSIYKELFYTPIWVGKDKITPFANILLNQIEDDITTPPTLKLDKRVKELKSRISQIYDTNSSIDKKINLELSFSKLYLDYMNYLVYGGINWRAFDAKIKQLSKRYRLKLGWEHYEPPYTPTSLLLDAVVSGDLNSAFKKGEPSRFHYQELKEYLKRYIQISKDGLYKKIPPFRRIKPNQSHRAIPAIRERLKLLGDLKEPKEDNISDIAIDSNDTDIALDLNSTNEPKIGDKKFYDKNLQEAIKRFKLRHGLEGNAIIDRATRKWLNMPIDKKIALIRLNLDRIKWVWHKENSVRIELNIPAFRLFLFEGEQLVDTIRVIVGKPNHPTPVFHDEMERIVVNPYWKIPQSIVKSEMLRHLIRDPYYYERRGKELHKDWDENSPLIDPGSINWAQYLGKRRIPYYFMQVPGSSNALGKIKFLFPNKYSVYIHDTNQKKLFFNRVRAYSHGCMRIQKPRELLKMLSHYNSNIDVGAIMQILGTREKQVINLERKIPVDIVYLTAFIDPYGNLNFRDDIYGYDKYQMRYYAYNPRHKTFKEQKHKRKRRRRHYYRRHHY